MYGRYERNNVRYERGEPGIATSPERSDANR